MATWASTLATALSVSIHSFVSGHHVYKKIWTLYVGETLALQQEIGNVHNRFAVAIMAQPATMIVAVYTESVDCCRQLLDALTDCCGRFAAAVMAQPAAMIVAVYTESVDCCGLLLDALTDCCGRFAVAVMEQPAAMIVGRVPRECRLLAVDGYWTCAYNNYVLEIRKNIYHIT